MPRALRRAGAGGVRLGLRLAPARLRRSRPSAAGVIRDVTGSYDMAWYIAGALCMLAAVMSISIRRNLPPAAEETALPNPEEAAAAQAHG